MRTGVARAAAEAEDRVAVALEQGGTDAGHREEARLVPWAGGGDGQQRPLVEDAEGGEAGLPGFRSGATS